MSLLNDLKQLINSKTSDPRKRDEILAKFAK